MSQSLVKNYIHIIYSTKHRAPLIVPPFEEELHGYLGGFCKAMESNPVIIGGHVDHIHMLCMLSKKIALMKLLEEVKSHSSRWMKTKDVSLNNFYWQNGYGAFSVNPSEVEKVTAYIKNQHEHHKGTGFQNELRVILKKYKIDYDERYVWD